MNEDEDETNETPDQDRYFIKIHRGRAGVFDSLAGSGDVIPVKIFAGPQALQNASAERDRLESLAASGVDPDATWKPLPSFVRPGTTRDALRQAEHAHTAALRSLAAEAEVLRRATERLLEVRGRIAAQSQTALSATQAAQDAERVLSGTSASMWLYGGALMGARSAEVRTEDPGEMPAPRNCER